MLNKFLKEASYAELKRGGKQERMENIEAMNLPNGRTLTTTHLSQPTLLFSRILFGQCIN